MNGSRILGFVVSGAVLMAVFAEACIAQPRGKPQPTAFYPTSASFSPNGGHVAVAFTVDMPEKSAYDGPLFKIWDTANGKEVKSYWQNLNYDKKYSVVDFISYLPDGKRILTVEVDWYFADPMRPQNRKADVRCRIWHAEKGEMMREFKVDHGRVGLSADGKKLLTGGEDGVGLWDVETGKMIAKLDLTKTGPPLWSALSPDGKWAAFRCRETSFFYDFDKKSLYHQKKLIALSATDKNTDVVYYVHPFLISPTGQTVLAHKYDRTRGGLVLCDVSTLNDQKQIRPMLPRDEVTQAVIALFTPDGRNLIILDRAEKNRRYSRKLACIDLKSTQTKWIKTDKDDGFRWPYVMAVSPKSDVVLLAQHLTGGRDNSGNVALFSVQTGEMVLRLDGNEVFPEGAFSRPTSKDK